METNNKTVPDYVRACIDECKQDGLSRSQFDSMLRQTLMATYHASRGVLTGAAEAMSNAELLKSWGNLYEQELADAEA